MNKAFVLGAGLGTRLRPLTDRLPKPLVPVFHRPLITYAFDHLRACGISEFIVNTHHLAEKYAATFTDGHYEGCPVTFRHEPVLLETAGGIANIADLVRDDSFMIYNGDILADLPLEPLLAAHSKKHNIVTLAVRSSGPGLHIALNNDRDLVTDIRNMLRSGNAGTHQFTGVYAASPELLEHLTPGKIESVIPVFLKLISEGSRVGAVVIDEGNWWDLGERAAYLDVHRHLLSKGATFPRYFQASNRGCFYPVSPGSDIHSSARLHGFTVVGPGCRIGAGAVVTDSVLWPGASVAPESRLTRCIVMGDRPAEGTLTDADV